MIFYIFLVAALNLGLGYGLAVYLGRRCGGLTATDDSWGTDAVPRQSTDDLLASEEDLAAGVGVLSEQPPQRQSAATEDEAAEDQHPSDERPDDGPRQKSVGDLGSGSREYHEKVMQADQKLRECAEAPHAAEIEAVLGSLKDSTQQYLEKRDRAHGTFKELSQGQPETSGIEDDLQAAIEREDKQIAGTRAIIEGFDYQSDLGEGCRQASEETRKLIGTIDQLQGMLDEVKVKLARTERQPPEAVPETPGDATEENADQTDMEAELMNLLGNDTDRDSYSSAAVIELDEFVQLEQEHGRDVAEKTLSAVARLLESNSGREEGSVFQVPQQRFLLRSPQTDAKLTASTAERLRQTIEKTCLRSDETEIRVTVSCAVVASVPEESAGELIRRAEATMQEAKRYGCNRTFLHDGKYPTPVMPPSFSIEEKQVTL